MTVGRQDATRTLLGFDYGRRRIGVAVGQELTLSARPLATLANRDAEPDWQAIGVLLSEWRPALLVVGLPYHADGSANQVTEAALAFCVQLEQRFRLPVRTIDERLSSWAACERQSRGGARRKTGAGLDAAAAALILESWLRENAQAG